MIVERCYGIGGLVTLCFWCRYLCGEVLCVRQHSHGCPLLWFFNETHGWYSMLASAVLRGGGGRTSGEVCRGQRFITFVEVTLDMGLGIFARQFGTDAPTLRGQAPNLVTCTVLSMWPVNNWDRKHAAYVQTLLLVIKTTPVHLCMRGSVDREEGVEVEP